MAGIWRRLRRGRDDREVVAPPEVAQEPAVLFGFTPRPSGDGGWNVTVWGPKGKAYGRPLAGLSHAQLALLTTTAGFATDFDAALALAGAWEEACAQHEDNAAVLDHFAEETSRITGIDPRG